MPYPPAKEAQDLVEQILLLVLVGIVAITVLAILGPVISNTMTETAWALFVVVHQ